MQPEVDLSERALAKHLTYLVQLQLRLRWLVILSETIHDELTDQVHFFGSGRQRCRVLLVHFNVLQDVLLIQIHRRAFRGPLRRLVASIIRFLLRLVHQIHVHDSLELLIHLHDGLVPPGRLLDKHIILPGSLN